MSHNVLNIQAQAGDVNGDITNTISQEMGLGEVLTNSAGTNPGGTGTYSAGDNYLFYTGADSYTDEGVSISGDTVSITGGIYIILCVPTFGNLASSNPSTDIRLQFQNQSGEGLGNIALCSRNSTESTYPSGQMCAAHVEGPADIVLKVISATAGDFPKNGTDNTASPFFIEVIRIK